MQPHRPGDHPHLRDGAGPASEGDGVRAFRLHLPGQLGRGQHHDGATRPAPHRPVHFRIPRVVEARFPELRHKQRRLGLALEVDTVFRGEHAVEHPQVARHGIRHAAVGGGGQEHRPSRRPRFLGHGHHVPVIGQGGGVEPDGFRHMPLERRPAPHQERRQQREQAQRARGRKAQQGLDQGVRADNRAVQVDDERDRGPARLPLRSQPCFRRQGQDGHGMVSC